MSVPAPLLISPPPPLISPCATTAEREGRSIVRDRPLRLIGPRRDRVWNGALTAKVWLELRMRALLTVLTQLLPALLITVIPALSAMELPLIVKPLPPPPKPPCLKV